MDSHLKTIRTELPLPGSPGRRNAILVHIYPVGPEIGKRTVLGSRPVVIGRGESSDILINDNSVSRRHALIQPAGSGYSVLDLGSTNGTFVNNVPVSDAALRDGDYLRVGNCIYRFLAGGNVEMEYHEEIYRLTIIDALTETHNKRYLLEFLDRELSRAQRHGRPLSLVMLDIDHFKRINDERGHLAGDYALRELAAGVRSSVRRDELFARYGGEECAVVLPETTPEDAVAFAERIRTQVADRPLTYDGEVFSVTISLGVACTWGASVTSADDLIRLADAALYRAKEGGRNCVRVWADDVDPS
jgi:diguanylate cyclase (GGDEF)-like protein